MFENRVLRRIIGPKRDEMEGEWRRLHNESFMIYTPHQILLGVIKSGRMRWAGHMARTGDRRGTYRVLVRRPE